MWIGLLCRGDVPRRWSHRNAGRLSLLAGMCVLAIAALMLTVGGGQARAAARPAVMFSAKAVPGSSAMQATSLVLPDGTPVPGTTVSVIATITPLNASPGAVVTPPSDNKSTLKDGLIADGLAVLVLLVLVGAIIVFLPLLRGGPDLARFKRANTRKAGWGRWARGAERPRRRRPGAQGGAQAWQRAPAPAAPAAPPSGRPEGRSKTRPLEMDETPKPASAVSSGGFSSSEPYPWQRAKNGGQALPYTGRGSLPNDEEEPPPPPRRPSTRKRARPQNWQDYE